MTENKRFTMDNESDIIEFDYNTNEYIQDFMWADGKSWDKICNRLNKLFDENEQLKQTIDRLTLDNTKQKKILNTTKKENERLKAEYKELRYANNIYCESIDNLKKENEHLKIQLTSILELIRKIEDYIHDIKLINGDGND